MLACAHTCSLLGVDASPVEVEVDLANGLPGFEVVGLAAAAVKEARERVRAAIKNCGYEFPLKRITVNLAPADLRKDGSHFDLPLAVALLAAGGQVDPEQLAACAFFGELSLDGRVQGVRGVLPMVDAVRRMPGQRLVVVPAENEAEALILPGVKVLAVHHLDEVVAFLQGQGELLPQSGGTAALPLGETAGEADLAQVRGQQAAKRALEVAAAGGHNILFFGPPGSGKTLLARCLPGLLPPLDLEEALEVTKVYSIAGLLPPEQPLLYQRPFRAPHHTASPASVIGGGHQPRPGEVTLASAGVLFLDELPEFPRVVLEALRQPLEEGVVQVTRVAASISYPAHFQLACAMNPCPCGYLGDPERECRCTPMEVARYRRRVSGPLLDRIDLQVEVPRVPYQAAVGGTQGEGSAAVRQRVVAARQLQRRRLGDEGARLNAALTGQQVEAFSNLEAAASRLMAEGFQKMRLSMRGYHRALKVARTIADLEGHEGPLGVKHVAEALSYHGLERRL